MQECLFRVLGSGIVLAASLAAGAATGADAHGAGATFPANLTPPGSRPLRS